MKQAIVIGALLFGFSGANAIQIQLFSSAPNALLSCHKHRGAWTFSSFSVMGEDQTEALEDTSSCARAMASVLVLGSEAITAAAIPGPCRALMPVSTASDRTQAFVVPLNCGDNNRE